MKELEDVFKARFDEMYKELKNEPKIKVEKQNLHIEDRKLIKLKDGYVFNIRDDFDHLVTGCPTCGLDDEYITNITFDIITNDNRDICANIFKCGYWRFEITVSDILILLLNNTDEMKEVCCEEFEQWLLDKLIYSKEE